MTYIDPSSLLRSNPGAKRALLWTNLLIYLSMRLHFVLCSVALLVSALPFGRVLFSAISFFLCGLAWLPVVWSFGSGTTGTELLSTDTGGCHPGMEYLFSLCKAQFWRQLAINNRSDVWICGMYDGVFDFYCLHINIRFKPIWTQNIFFSCFRHTNDAIKIIKES